MTPQPLLEKQTGSGGAVLSPHMGEKRKVYLLS